MLCGRPLFLKFFSFPCFRFLIDIDTLSLFSLPTRHSANHSHRWSASDPSFRRTTDARIIYHGDKITTLTTSITAAARQHHRSHCAPLRPLPGLRRAFSDPRAAHHAWRNCLQWLVPSHPHRWHLRSPGHEEGNRLLEQVCQRRDSGPDSHLGAGQGCLHCPEWECEVSDLCFTSLPQAVFSTQEGETRTRYGVGSFPQQCLTILCRINDAVMELLIMVSACKGGSSRSITGMTPP